MSRNIAGAEYVEAISERASDRHARDAFQDLILRLSPRGASLLDFGAGPGIDARFYCEHGFEVCAYDVDPAMGEYCAQHCRDLIDSGRLRLQYGDFARYLAGAPESDARPVQIIASNFAPLSLIENLQPLFARFHALCAPQGMILASVLNPYFIGDMRYGWWWRNLAKLWRSGCYAVPGAQAPIVRRRLATFAAQCAPHFRLVRVYRGLPPRSPAERQGIDTASGVHAAWRRLTGSRFIFLMFRRCD